MKKLALLIFFAAIGPSSFIGAQNVPPALMVPGEKKSEPLKVTSVSVESRIYGYYSETSMTLTFYNSQNRQLAGDLYFPLPEGATVTGYALDIAGIMVEGVAVEKQQARRVFEKIVRQGIDPGLVEWVKGNNFKTRVFPIPPRGSRTVKVRYQSELVEREDGFTYRLPLRFPGRVDDFSIRVEVVKSPSLPEVKQVSVGDLQFFHQRESYIAETSEKNILLDRDLEIYIPQTKTQAVLVERAPDGLLYFALNEDPPPAPAYQSAPPPGRIALYWDASRSGEKSRHARFYRQLSAYFEKLGKASPGITVRVDLFVFRNRTEEPRQFEIKEGDASSLIAHLMSLTYDGGTQMGALPQPEDDTDFALLFSDGISNFGREEPEIFGVPLYVFSSGAGANHSFLRYLALKNTGQYFNLDRLEDATVLERIGKPVYGFIKAEVLNGSVEEGYPQTPQPVAGRFSYLGKLKSQQAVILLQYGINGKVLKESRHVVKFSGNSSETSSGIATGELLQLAWARRKLADLEVFPRRNQALITDLGNEFNMVTPRTSLIVLESLNQYVEHRIPPPTSLTEMRKEYFAIMTQQKQYEEEQQESKLAWILELWEERVSWWHTKFSYPPDLRIRQEAQKAEGAETDEELEAEPVAAPEISEEMTAGAPRPLLQPMETVEADKKLAEGTEETLEPEMVVTPWDPETPYLNAFRETDRDSLYTEYLRQREGYGESAAFYLDCGDYFFKQNLPDLGLRIWSNIAELELENAALVRILAHRLSQENYLELSRMLFEEVLRLRPEEPQSYRDLGLVLGRLNEFEEAIRLLYIVVMRPWDRFHEIEVIALMELNALIPKARKAGVQDVPVNSRLVKLLDVDLRIVLTWDADLTDMDLWITEPSEEKAYYGNRRTTIGGHFSRDFTDGYGPEEYLLKKSMKGKYIVEVNYFSSGAPTISGSVTLQVDLFTNYGRTNEKRQSITVRLRENNETLHIGEISF